MSIPKKKSVGKKIFCGRLNNQWDCLKKTYARNVFLPLYTCTFIFKKRKTDVLKIDSIKVHDGLLQYFLQYLRSNKLKRT